MSRDMNRKRLLKVSAFVAGLIIYYFFTRFTHLGIPCVFRLVTHLKCPGCGITHLFLALGQGDIQGAFLSNPVVFCALPFLSVEFFRMLKSYLYEKELHTTRLENIIWYLLAGILLIFGVIRNIPAIKVMISQLISSFPPDSIF